MTNKPKIHHVSLKSDQPLAENIPVASDIRLKAKAVCLFGCDLSGATIHLLDGIYQPVSSTAIRQAAAAGKPLGRFVEPSIADYIKKMGLYKSGFPQE